MQVLGSLLCKQWITKGHLFELVTREINLLTGGLLEVWEFFSTSDGVHVESTISSRTTRVGEGLELSLLLLTTEEAGEGGRH